MDSGILIIDKPVDWTSHDVVGKMRKILKTKRIGHTGTLDPFATGVLVILVGKATRLAQFLDKDTKEYEALVRFGFETDTGDLTGLRKAAFGSGISESPKTLTEKQIEEVLKDFRGEIEQVPPMYSAKKIAGKKLYELARQGIEIERKPVNVKIYELETVVGGRWSMVSGGKAISDAEKVISGQWTVDSEKLKTIDPQPLTTDHCIRVACSAGTYIRTLAEDIGRKLETGAHLAALRRTKAGKFGIEKSVTLEKLEEIVAAGQLADILISMNDALAHLPEVTLSAEELRQTQNGIGLKVISSEIQANDVFRMTDEYHNLAAIGFYNVDKNVIQPRIVLA